MQSNPDAAIAADAGQPMGPGNQAAQLCRAGRMPRQQFVPRNYYHRPTASQVNFYATPQATPVSYQQPQPDGQSNTALLLQMLHESDYPSQREWAADQLATQSGSSQSTVVHRPGDGREGRPRSDGSRPVLSVADRMQVPDAAGRLALAADAKRQRSASPRRRPSGPDRDGMPPRKSDDVQPVSAPVDERSE